MPLADIASLLTDPSSDQLDAWSKRVERDAVQRHQALDLARILLAIAPIPDPPTEKTHQRRASMTTLNTIGRTDIGRVRKDNEDVVVSTDRLAAVADGMGGHPGGEVASTIAIALMQAAFTGRSLDELQAGVRAGNRAIWDRTCESTEIGWDGYDDLCGWAH